VHDGGDYTARGPAPRKDAATKKDALSFDLKPVDHAEIEVAALFLELVAEEDVAARRQLDLEPPLGMPTRDPRPPLDNQVRSVYSLAPSGSRISIAWCGSVPMFCRCHTGWPPETGAVN
jgi:hypothetical protein